MNFYEGYLESEVQGDYQFPIIVLRTVRSVYKKEFNLNSFKILNTKYTGDLFSTYYFGSFTFFGKTYYCLADNETRKLYIVLARN